MNLALILILITCCSSEVKTMPDLKITSLAFNNKSLIPTKYTCDGNNINPPLNIENIPRGTKSLVLIMDDPDIPEEIKKRTGIKVFDHWIVFNIPPRVSTIRESNQPIGIRGRNSNGTNSYTGPCPPPQYQPKEHRYFFKIYALDTELKLEEGAKKKEVEEAMKNHIIAKSELVGLYSRK